MISNDKWTEVYDFLDFTANMNIPVAMAIGERAAHHHDQQMKEVLSEERRAMNRAVFERCQSVCWSAQARAGEMLLDFERYNSRQDIDILVEFAECVRTAKQVKKPPRARPGVRLEDVNIPDAATLRALHPTAAPWQTISLFEASGQPIG